jgi:hypothetical protein
VASVRAPVDLGFAERRLAAVRRGQHHEVTQEELRSPAVCRLAPPGDERQGDLKAVAVALGVALGHGEAEREAGKHCGGAAAGGEQGAQHRAVPSQGTGTTP